MASILSVLIQVAEPANYKLNYDEHYLISVPIATTTTPGIASFDNDYFSVVNGKVILKHSILAGKVDKVIPDDRGIFAYVVQKDADDTVSNYVIEISEDTDADTIARRYAHGRLRVSDGVYDTDAVNKGQLTAATTNIPKSALASAVQTSLGKADTAYQKPGTGIPETDLSTDVRTKLNKVISRVGITPEAWEVLPIADRDINTMYFVGPYGTSPNQYFVEWMYFVNNGVGTWEAIGSTQAVDLSSYFTKSEVNALLSGKANITGKYVTLGAGFADFAAQIETDREIEDADEACPPVVFGSVGGAAEVQDGLMKFTELRGHTIKWNQLVQNGNFADTSGWGNVGGTIDVADNILSYTLTSIGLDWASNRVTASNVINLLPSHKYLFCIKSKTPYSTEINIYTNTKVSLGLTTAGVWSFLSAIVNIGSEISTNASIYFDVHSQSSYQIGDVLQLQTVQCFDLTAIYGAGNEPSTVTDFVRDFPLPYYAYNAGTILSSKSASVILRGRNQWDEEWEVGYYYQGEARTGNYVRSKNYIRVLPSETYYAFCGSNSVNDYFTIEFYDGNKNYISRTVKNQNTTFDMPSNCSYIRFYMNDTYGTTYNHDICIYINWETPGLPYVPYSAQIVTLPNLELKSTGSAYDVLYQQGGGKRRIGSIDLGSLTWYYLGTADHEAMYSIGLQSLAKFPASDSTAANILCVPFTTVTRNQQYNHSSDFIIAMSDNGTLFVYSTTMGTTGADFKTAMSGVMLYYELATETDITTTENPGWTEYAEINNFGTIEFMQDPAQTIPVPQAYFIRYTVNLVEFLDSLYVRCGGDASKIALLEDINIPDDPTSDGTYTLKVTVSGGVKTRSWVVDT